MIDRVAFQVASPTPLSYVSGKGTSVLRILAFDFKPWLVFPGVWLLVVASWFFSAVESDILFKVTCNITRVYGMATFPLITMPGDVKGT